VSAPVSSNPSNATRDAVAILIGKGDYWSARSPDLAIGALRQALALQPDNVDALVMLAGLQLDRGDVQAAATPLGRLHRLAPSDTRVLALDQRADRGPVDPYALGEARRLSDAGKPAEALQKYAKAFGPGTPPPPYFIEFYMTMARLNDRAAEARAALAHRVTEDPRDLQAQLAYAQLLSYYEPTRPDALDRFEVLSQQQAIEPLVRQAWRQTLLWQGASLQAQGKLKAYLARYPSDAQLDVLQQEYRGSLPDESAQLRMAAYEDMENKHYQEAEKKFQRAFDNNPGDADSLIMLAVLRNSRHQPNEAKRLAAQAIAIAPDRRDDFIKAIGGDAVADADFANQIEIARLTTIGQYDAAERLLAQSIAGHESAASLVQLGAIQIRAGRLDAAETSLRRARSLKPDSGDASYELAHLVALRGHYDESAVLLTEAAGLYGSAKNRLGLRKVAIGRAELLRIRVARLDDGAATKLYQAALTSDPTNMAIRVDLARLLQKAGQPDQARAVMAKGVEVNHGDVNSLQVALDFAREAGDQPRVADLSRRLGSRGVVAVADRRLNIRDEITEARLAAMRRSYDTVATQVSYLSQ
jgi:tetratricopeptide (TPR) repeat protein